MSAYAEFAVTTNFSFLRGASHAEELVDRAKTLGLAGIGIADRNSVAGVVRAHQAAKEAGLKCAPGARLAFADGTPDILAYPQDRAAWGRLTRLLTLGKRRTEKGECLLYCDDLLAEVTGLSLIVCRDASGAALLPPLPACHQGVHARLRRAMERVGVRGRFHKLRLAERPPPYPPPQAGEGKEEAEELTAVPRRAGSGRGDAALSRTLPVLA